MAIYLISVVALLSNRIGEKEPRRLQKQFGATAKLVDPLHSAAGQGAAALGHEHPGVDSVILSLSGGLASLVHTW